MNKPLMDYVPLVHGVRGLVSAPPEVVVEHVRKAATEFADRTRVWQEDVHLDVQANVLDYPVDMIPEADLVGLEKVVANARCTPMCQRVYLKDGAVWVPCPAEDEFSAYVLTLSWKPAVGACGLSGAWASEYADAIADGAAAGLFVMPKAVAPWFNTALATYYRRMFELAISTTKNKLKLAQTNGRPLMMTGARF